jgi:opacity protein-like surface antigen
MMKTLLAISALAVLSGSAAVAADIPVKAPQGALFSGYPYVGQGFYFGLNSFAAAGSAEASAPGLNTNSLITNQGAIGVTIGYVWATQNVFYAVEGMFDFTNLNGSAPGLSFNGPAAFEQRIKIGTPLNNFLNLFPTLGLPSIPPFPALPDGQVATNIHPYLMGGLHEDAIGLNLGTASNKTWQISPSIGLGMMGQLTKGIAIDTWAEVIFANKSVCVGAFAAGCVKQDTKYQIGFGVYY